MTTRSLGCELSAFSHRMSALSVDLSRAVRFLRFFPNMVEFVSFFCSGVSELILWRLIL